MNPTENSPKDGVESKNIISVAELNDRLQQLPPERLQVLAIFLDYLANVESDAATQELQEISGLLEKLASAESDAATQELLEIPGLLERIKQNQTTPKTEYANWRTLRSDV